MILDFGMPSVSAEAEELLQDAAVVEDCDREVERAALEVLVARHRAVPEHDFLDFRGPDVLAVDVVAAEAARQNPEPGVVLEALAAGRIAAFSARQQDELERPDVLDAGVQHVEDRLAVLGLGIGRKP